MSGKTGRKPTGRKPQSVRRQSGKTEGAFGKEGGAQVETGGNRNLDRSVRKKNGGAGA